MACCGYVARQVPAATCSLVTCPSNFAYVLCGQGSKVVNNQYCVCVCDLPPAYVIAGPDNGLSMGCYHSADASTDHDGRADARGDRD